MGMPAPGAIVETDPPNWLATQSPDAVAARPVGPSPTGTVCATPFVFGLICETVRFPLFVTHTKPRPTATPAGPDPTVIFCTAWLVGSIRATVSSPESATQTASAPAAIDTGRAPTAT